MFVCRNPLQTKWEMKSLREEAGRTSLRLQSLKMCCSNIVKADLKYINYETLILIKNFNCICKWLHKQLCSANFFIEWISTYFSNINTQIHFHDNTIDNNNVSFIFLFIHFIHQWIDLTEAFALTFTRVRIQVFVGKYFLSFAKLLKVLQPQSLGFRELP